MAQQEGPKRLYRSRRNRIIGGVAGGIAEYFGIDPIIIRILFVVFAFSGFGIIAYIAALILVPERPEGESIPQVPASVSNEVSLILGLVLVGLGIWFLLSNLNLVPQPFFALWRFLSRAFWPIVLILIGILVIATASRGGITTHGRLHRSRHNKMIGGVAGGLAEYFGVDVTLVRLGWVVAGLLAPPAAILAYVIALIVIPEEPAEPGKNANT